MICASSIIFGEILCKTEKEGRVMASKVVNISLPEELLEEVDQLARQEKRTRSELFREAVRRYLEAKELRAPLTFTELDRRGWAALADSALARIWENEEDAIYDGWQPERSRTNQA